MRNLDTEFKGWNTTVKTGIIEGITKGTIDFAKNFGHYLAKDESEEKNGKKITSCGKLTTSQLRKFFGAVKRLQTTGYNESSFLMLKPQLAYAVGRAKNGNNNNKIKDLYEVLSVAIDTVVDNETKNPDIYFKNFIAIFEAIVAYHKEKE